MVHEEDYMFGDLRMVIFYAACIGFTILGAVIVARKPNQIRVAKPRPRGYESKSWMMLAIPLGFAILLDLASMAVILKSNPSLIFKVFSGQGQDIKNNLDVQGAFNGAQPMLMGMVWWAQLRYFSDRRSWRPLHRKLLFWMILSGFFICIFLALIKLARYEAIPLVLGSLMILMRTYGSGRSAWYFVSRGALGAFGIIFLFALMGIVRGVNPFENLMGYGPASFNHLSVMLEGKLRYNPGGTYTIGFLGTVPVLHHYVDTGTLLDLPSSKDAFQQQFDLSRAAGLNGALIWVTAFGYYFVDLGYWVFAWCFGTGLLMGLAWNSFNKQKPLGMVMYPLLAACALLWSTFNYLTRPPTITLFFVALFLIFWEKLPMWRDGFKRRRSSSISENAVIESRQKQSGRKRSALA
jgi:hypothetical protein